MQKEARNNDKIVERQKKNLASIISQMEKIAKQHEKKAAKQKRMKEEWDAQHLKNREQNQGEKEQSLEPDGESRRKHEERKKRKQDLMAYSEQVISGQKEELLKRKDELQRQDFERNVAFAHKQNKLSVEIAHKHDKTV